MLNGMSNVHSQRDHQNHHCQADKVREDDALRNGVVLAEVIVTQRRRIEVACHADAGGKSCWKPSCD